MQSEERQNRNLQDFKEGILDAAEKIGRGETGYTRKELEENCKKNILPYEPILLPQFQDIYIKDYFKSLSGVWVKPHIPYVIAGAYEGGPTHYEQNVIFLDCLSYDWRKAYRGPEDIQRDISSHPGDSAAKPSVRYCFTMAEKIANHMEVTPSLKEYLPVIAALLYLKFSNRELGVLYFPFESPSIGGNKLYRGRYLLKTDEKRAKQAQELFKSRFEIQLEEKAEALETATPKPKEELIHEYLATLLFLYILFHNPLYEKLDIEVIQKNIEVFGWYTFGLIQALIGDYPDGISPSEKFVENVHHVTETIFKKSPADGTSSTENNLKYSFMLFDFFATRRMQYGEIPNWAIIYKETGIDPQAYIHSLRLKEEHPYLLREQLHDISPIRDDFDYDYFDYLDTDGQMKKV